MDVRLVDGQLSSLPIKFTAGKRKGHYVIDVFVMKDKILSVNPLILRKY